MKPAGVLPLRKRVHLVRKFAGVGGYGEIYETPVSLPAAPWDELEEPESATDATVPPRRKPGGGTR
ncbi:hypothetical protein [Frigidibacter oleivorans]|uniref:hypothetical protein n=1 Tax=Frigidibacter oleivorans TaxID=2487129 RepID=UPI000F8F2BCC|nr:hypothetical protein [Frigidibacter oleivorans]